MRIIEGAVERYEVNGPEEGFQRYDEALSSLRDQMGDKRGEVASSSAGSSRAGVPSEATQRGTRLPPPA